MEPKFGSDYERIPALRDVVFNTLRQAILRAS